MTQKKRRALFAAALLVCFGIGSYIWKMGHTGAYFWHSQDVSVDDLDFTLYIGDYLITREEIDWEYKFYIQQLDIPELGSLAESRPLSPRVKPETKAPDSAKLNLELYNKIFADLIERKLLYQFITADQHFQLKEPARFTSCLTEWQLTIDRMAKDFANEEDRTHLKSMLCEKAILDQYLNERIVSSIKISDEDVEAYYLEHKREFIEPAKVYVRQIVLGTETEAKKVKEKVNIQNFGEMAKQLSIAPEAKNGGRLGPFIKGELPSIFDIAFEMKPGSIEGILKSTYGFHILMLEKKIPKVELSLEGAKPKIVGTLTKRRRDEDYKKWVDSALNTIPIKSSRAF